MTKCYKSPGFTATIQFIDNTEYKIIYAVIGIIKTFYSIKLITFRNKVYSYELSDIQNITLDEFEKSKD